MGTFLLLFSYYNPVDKVYMDNITKTRASPEDLLAYVFSDMHVICVEICSQFVLIFNFTGVEEILIAGYIRLTNIISLCSLL